MLLLLLLLLFVKKKEAVMMAKSRTSALVQTTLEEKYFRGATLRRFKKFLECFLISLSIQLC